MIEARRRSQSSIPGKDFSINGFPAITDYASDNTAIRAREVYQATMRYCSDLSGPPRESITAAEPLGLTRTKPRKYRILLLPRIKAGPLSDMG
jgi:hypothetical protein